MIQTEHECPLSACPRSYDSLQELESHGKTIHPLPMSVLERCSQTYESDDKDYRVGLDSIGNSVTFEYVTCDFCGERKTVPERNVSKFSSFFCDSNCRSEYYSGKNNPNWKERTRNGYYGNDWRKIRSERVQKDGEQCVICNASQQEHYRRYDTDLHVHHIAPGSEFKTDDGIHNEEANQISNVVTLCSPCHSRHEGKSRDFFEQYLATGGNQQ